MIDQSSVRRFSTGVPVRATRWMASKLRTAWLCLATGFLMYCASSRTIRPHLTFEIVSLSRLAKA